MANSNGKSKKIIVLILMMLALSTIYILPYLRYSFYIPLQEAMGLVGQNEKYGTLTSIYGIANFLLYIPGGWIADRFDPKKLMVFSMVSTGALGLWLATWPGYTTLLVIYALLGVTTVLTFWSASIKCINVISASDEQGSMFSGLEAGRGVVSLLVTTMFLAIYAMFQADSTKSMSAVVISCSAVMILVGIALAFLMPKTEAAGVTNTNIKDSLLAMGKAFKMPVTYILAGMLFCAQMCTQVGSYYAPYLTEGCGMDVMPSTVFANYRTVLCGVVGGVIAIILSKKAGRSARVIIWAGLVAAVMYAVLTLAPASAALVWPLVIIMVIATTCNNVFRSLYYAVIDEVGTQKNIVGSVIGVASLIGFLPDAFFGTVCGSMIDNYGLDGYKRIFFAGILAVTLGLVCAFLGNRATTKYRDSLPAETAE
jgi:Arabinose efflux permease